MPYHAGLRPAQTSKLSEKALVVNENNGRSTLILVVDDSAFLRKRIRQALQEEGYMLVEAASGSSALAEIDKQEFACILTDLVMPELDGFGLLAELQKRHLQTPVVVVTADIQKSTRERCELLGAAAFVQKPVNPDTLRSALAGVLSGRC
jgi:CheY-like chemotaxis protein